MEYAVCKNNDGEGENRRVRVEQVVAGWSAGMLGMLERCYRHR